MNIPLISVIVPVYNAEKYIKRCVDSILNQTYGNIEIILVNDESTDNSFSLLSEYESSDQRIVVINQTNSGPDYARKAGVVRAKGEYITFVDADDYIEYTMIADMVAKAQEYDCEMVTTYPTRFNDEGKFWVTDAFPHNECIFDETEQILTEYFCSRIISGAYYGKLYKKELFDEYEFQKDSVIGEDVAGVLYVLLRVKNVLVLSESYYKYYWNTKSISHSKYTPRHLKSLKYYMMLREHLLNLHLINDQAVVGYFAEYEMAVATAMARKGKYVKETGKLLKSDIGRRLKDILANKYTAAYMKLCIMIYVISPRVFVLLYRIFYLLTGR